jgi:hypothetical protein
LSRCFSVTATKVESLDILDNRSASLLLLGKVGVCLDAKEVPTKGNGEDVTIIMGCAFTALDVQVLLVDPREIMEESPTERPSVETETVLVGAGSTKAVDEKEVFDVLLRLP